MSFFRNINLNQKATTGNAWSCHVVLNIRPDGLRKHCLGKDKKIKMKEYQQITEADLKREELLNQFHTGSWKDEGDEVVDVYQYVPFNKTKLEQQFRIHLVWQWLFCGFTFYALNLFRPFLEKIGCEGKRAWRKRSD